MLIQVIFEFVDSCAVLLLQLLFLLRKLLLSQVLNLSQLLFEFELDVQEFINHLLIEIFQMLMWYVINLVDLVRIIGINFIFHAFFVSILFQDDVVVSAFRFVRSLRRATLVDHRRL